MGTTQTSRLKRIASRVKYFFTELDYAQRRLWEIRTDLPGATQQKRPRKRGSSHARPRGLSGTAQS
jgi:hypothetical protein